MSPPDCNPDAETLCRCKFLLCPPSPSGEMKTHSPQKRAPQGIPVQVRGGAPFACLVLTVKHSFRKGEFSVRLRAQAPFYFHGLGVAEAELAEALACGARDSGFESHRSPLSRGSLPGLLMARSPTLNRSMVVQIDLGHPDTCTRKGAFLCRSPEHAQERKEITARSANGKPPDFESGYPRSIRGRASRSITEDWPSGKAAPC